MASHRFLHVKNADSSVSVHGPHKPPVVRTRPPAPISRSAVETAMYVVDFTTELSSLARNSRLDLLAYLLDMARLEAIRVVQANSRES